MAAGIRIRLDHRALDQLLESEDGPVGKMLARAAIKVDAAAKRLCPVDTGRLRSSITWTLGRDSLGLLAVVGTNVTYAMHVEFGTINMAAQPYLRPALAAAR